MTAEERDKYIADCCDGFKRALLSKASKIPKNWDCTEIQQWIMDYAKDAWVPKMTPARMRSYNHTKQIFGL